MAKLGDFLSHDMRDHFPIDYLKTGDVIRIPVEFKGGENKFLLIVGKDRENKFIATVVINSVINAHVHRTTEAKHYQLFLKKEKNQFLRKDSDADYTKLELMPYQKTKEIVEKDTGCFLGTVCEEDLKEIFLRLSSAPDIKIKQKEKYGLWEEKIIKTTFRHLLHDKEISHKVYQSN